jgi:subtilisin family serine protease
VIVAVIDSGLQVDHPDLAGSLWTNPGEVINGRDDDGNGYVDDVHGINVLNGGTDLSDDEGHGTAVAGIIAARAGNGIGVAGLAPQAQIMPIKAADRSRLVPTVSLRASATP